MVFKTAKEAGVHFAKNRRSAEAFPYLCQALQESPSDPDVLYYLAAAKSESGEFEDASALLARIVQLDPAYYKAYHLQGAIACFAGEFERAEYLTRRCLEIAPNLPFAMWNLSQLELRRGDYKNGFDHFRWGRTAKVNHVRAHGNEWDGSTVDTLLVWAEQGMGDILQMLRFVPDVCTMAKNVILEVYKPLVALVDSQGFDAMVVGQPEDWHQPYKYDAHVSVMDLPRICGVESPNDLHGRPYIKAPEGSRPNEGQRGVCWKGAETHDNDAQRSMTDEDLAPLKGFEFVSFQNGETLYDWPCQRFGDYAQTAQALDGLDLLVTVDTSVAHLAGAMGVPTWLIAPLNGEWRWGDDGDTVCWYESVRVFRPTLAEGFGPVIQQIAKELNELDSKATMVLSGHGGRVQDIDLREGLEPVGEAARILV